MMLIKTKLFSEFDLGVAKNASKLNHIDVVGASEDLTSWIWSVMTTRKQ